MCALCSLFFPAFWVSMSTATKSLLPPSYLSLSPSLLSRDPRRFLSVADLPVLFVWRVAARGQKEQVAEMRRCNEALVINMLPEHVAKHFLGTKKRDGVCICLL